MCHVHTTYVSTVTLLISSTSRFRKKTLEIEPQLRSVLFQLMGKSPFAFHPFIFCNLKSKHVIPIISSLDQKMVDSFLVPSALDGNAHHDSNWLRCGSSSMAKRGKQHCRIVTKETKKLALSFRIFLNLICQKERKKKKRTRLQIRFPRRFVMSLSRVTGLTGRGHSDSPILANIYLNIDRNVS